MKGLKGLIFTRTMYCKRCEKNGSPAIGENVILYGGRSHSIRAVKVTEVPPLGFTPHLIEVLYSSRDVSKIRICCCIDGCGVYIHISEDEFELDIIKVEEIKMPNERLIGLMNFKEKEFYVC